MFFQDTPPDTSSYMILGYAVFFIVTAIYLASFFVRSRNLKQDLSMLESMKPESKGMESKAPVSKAATVTAPTGNAKTKQPAKTKTTKTKAPASKTKKKK